MNFFIPFIVTTFIHKISGTVKLPWAEILQTFFFSHNKGNQLI